MSRATRKERVQCTMPGHNENLLRLCAESDVQWQGGEEELLQRGAARARHHHLADWGRVRVQLQEWQHGGDQ